MRRLVPALVVAAALAAAPGAAPIAGPLRTLVIPLTWGPEPLTDVQVRALADGATSFLDRASFGRLALQADTTPWLHAFAAPAPCTDVRVIHDAAVAAAAAAGYDAAGYSRRIYLLPYDAATCRNDGPFGLTVGRDIVVVGRFRAETLAHELGHTFGLGHARRRLCTPTCSVGEYGDPHDAMADASGDFNALEKALAGWLPALTVLTAPGDFVVDELEVPTALPQALVVVSSAGEYWIDHREPLGNDASLAGPATQGIEVRLRDHPILSAALNLTPSTLLSDPADRAGGAVLPGGTFAVPGAFELQVLDHVGTHVDVRFRWLDHTAPGRVTLGAPQSAHGVVHLAWAAARDAGSGVARYDVSLDGGPATPTGAEKLALPARAGAHVVGIVAVDRAGNRSRLATRRFVVGRSG